MSLSLETESTLGTVTSSRKLRLAFAATFLLGAGAGALVMSNFADQRLSGFMKRTSDPITMAARIDQNNATTYALTSDQKEAIKPLTQAFTNQLYALRNQFAQSVLAAMDDYHGKVAAQMTAEQRALYAKDNAQRKQRVSQMLLVNQGSPSPAQN